MEHVVRTARRHAVWKPLHWGRTEIQNFVSALGTRGDPPMSAGANGEGGLFLLFSLFFVDCCFGFLFVCFGSNSLHAEKVP